MSPPVEVATLVDGVEHLLCRGTKSCGILLPLGAFGKLSAKAGRGKMYGLQYRCKKCSRKDAKERAEAGLLEARKQLHRQAIKDAKNKPCMDCGIWYPPYVMDFDHRPGETKLFNVGRGAYGNMEGLLSEIAKCDVVCSNCHRIRTFTRRGHTA